MRQETAYYEAYTNEAVDAIVASGPEAVVTCKGTILVSFPPAKEETAGGIVLPEKARKAQDVGKVLCVPEDEKCPVSVGDTVIVRHLAGDPVKLFGRDDLRFIQYTDDAASEILGYIPGGYNG